MRPQLEIRFRARKTCTSFWKELRPLRKALEDKGQHEQSLRTQCSCPDNEKGSGGAKDILVETEGSSSESLPTFTSHRVCPRPSPKSKNLHQSPSKVWTKGMSALSLAPGSDAWKNSWDYLLLSEMDLEPP